MIKMTRKPKKGSGAGTAKLAKKTKMPGIAIKAIRGKSP